MPALLGDEEMMDVRHESMGSPRSADAAARSSSSAFGVLSTDARGNLVASRLPLRPLGNITNGESSKQANIAVISEEPVMLYKARGAGAAKGDLVVQRIASGAMYGRERVTALARKDGSIDLLETSADAKLLLTIRNADMKKGMHRWVGLAVAHDGIFACTSAGDMRFFPVTSAQGQAGSSNGAAQLPALELDESKVARRDLPEPLQHVVFEPASNPKHFSYGGEEVPLSIWDARRAFTPAQELQSPVSDKTNGVHNGTNNNDDTSELTNKQKKRKRAAENRAKAAELLWGETWRAKNLPNDALSLPQRANILCILPLGESKWAVGTKLGQVRIYDIAQQRKHIREFKVFDAPIKHLESSYSGTELIASDPSGRIFVVDARSGATLYQYKGITGAVSALQSLPPASSSDKISKQQTSYLLSSSADRMLRLHSVPLPSKTEASDEGRKTTRQKGAIIISAFMREGVSTLSWDGVVPEADEDAADEEDAPRRRNTTANGSEASEDEEPDNDDDDVWDEMATVEQKRSSTRHAGDDADERDDTVAKEDRSKRRK